MRFISAFKTNASQFVLFVMDDWITGYAIPIHVLTDNRTQFINKSFEVLWAILDTKHLTT